jgi:hypothetical protein
MFTKPLPRFVIAKRLVGGGMAFYFNVPTLSRKLGCAVPNEPLGADYTHACGDDGMGAKADRSRAVSWFGTEPLIGCSEDICQERVSTRTRPDYERIMQLVCGVVTKRVQLRRARQIKSTPE